MTGRRGGLPGAGCRVIDLRLANWDLRARHNDVVHIGTGKGHDRSVGQEDTAREPTRIIEIARLLRCEIATLVVRDLLAQWNTDVSARRHPENAAGLEDGALVVRRLHREHHIERAASEQEPRR